ncbi:hypothetical protein BB8028_0004g09170 [Beauveria bassiana]|uniref:DOC domain-containing protein n=1 Tax=Beauveria bassiana TaxID=176275 RepID=A0A2S7YCU4_BEABA|nr:hypothetical protein BB8028_0004g09170 [Beauveria bassiana]
MNIQRGSRRARHVAANTAANQAAQTEQQQPQPDSPPATQEDNGHSLLPPTRPPQTRNVHRTPEQRQPESDDEHQMPTVAPRVNPFRLHRSTRGTTTPRLSMPLGSDASDSDPDLSVLAMARGSGRTGAAQGPASANTLEEQVLLQQQAEAMAYEDEVMSQEQYEAEDTSIDEQVEEEEEEQDEQEVLVDPASIGLKEISNLGKFTVSSHKPGHGVQELRSDDLKLYWQSDGPQPHKLTVYFVKRVGIRVIRFFVDYQEDESYTPTKILFRSGTSENNMIEFATMTMDNPYGWQDVPISGAGGEPDGNTLVSYVLQMQILENHQNGKDTHLRGIKIYAFDPDSGQQAGGRRQQQNDDAEGIAAMVASSKQAGDGSGGGERLSDVARILASSRVQAGESAFSAADFLREPELR